MTDYSQLPWSQRVEGFLWNAATGTLTDSQKQALITQQAAAVSDASSGAISPTDALTQAQQDVTTVLTQDNADPTQASLFNNPGLNALFQKAGWVVVIVVSIFLIYYGMKLVKLSR